MNQQADYPLEVNLIPTCEDRKLITQIVERAEQLFSSLDVPVDRFQLAMDITATHLNGCPLRLHDLLEADNFNFVHDVGGIRNHIDRTTGKLHHFLPCFAVPEA